MNAPFHGYARRLEQGLARAEYMYGMRHPRSSLSNDIAVAAEWFRKAAEQDYAPTQYMLGTLYQRSNNDDTLIVAGETKTIVEDLAEADHWFTICWKRAFGDIAVRCGTSIYEIERHMSADDNFESQTRAFEWIQAYDSRQQ